MKKLIYPIFILIFLLNLAAYADGNPLTADRLNDGSYSIAVTSSSSMFRITDCTLNVQNGEMTADITLSGTGYEKLYMGKGADAENAAESDYIFFTDNDGKYTYTVPVEALDKDIDCAAFSIRRQEWYDRTLVFVSASLPDGAIKKSGDFPLVIICIAALTLIIAVTALFVYRKNRK